jgi:pimeloyl-ACP methyl ester carboxylesterase
MPSPSFPRLDPAGLPAIPGPPPKILELLELRVVSELATAFATLPLLQQAPRGDGHPVLVFPGLIATDASTKLLRAYLTERGYDAHGWGLGRNVGLVPDLESKMRARVEDLHARSGRALSLVGFSLGGVYARAMAADLPHAVRSVITLGAPIRGHPKDTNVWRLYELASGRSVDDVRLRKPRVPPARIPATSIYTRSDGLVAWQACVEATVGRRECIEIMGSHCGLAVNAAALHAVADRLAQPEGEWWPFERSGWRAVLYPDPNRTE